MHFLRSLNQLNEYYLKNRGQTTGKHKLSLTKVCHPVTFYLLASKSKKSENICIHKNNNHTLTCSIYTLNVTCMKYCNYPKIYNVKQLNVDKSYRVEMNTFFPVSGFIYYLSSPYSCLEVSLKCVYILRIFSYVRKRYHRKPTVDYA